MRSKASTNPLNILFSDDLLFVVDKPAGFTIDDLEKWINNPNLPRSGIVHRLDKETSGVILVAKTKDSLEFLQHEFFERKVHKTYQALVHGRVKETSGTISANVGRLKENRKKFGVIINGRPALTNYLVLKYFKLNKELYTLLKIEPKTGRTHQIRIHLKHIGHSIVADPLYAGGKTLRHDHEICPRMFLHANSISFIHPGTKEEFSISVDLPADLKKVLDSIAPEIVN